MKSDADYNFKRRHFLCRYRRDARPEIFFGQKLAAASVPGINSLRPNCRNRELITPDLVEWCSRGKNILPFPQDGDITQKKSESLRKL